MRLGNLRRSRQSGYVMMVLLFMMALLLFATAATAPAVKQQLQRDREEEMIHRGAQYARAIKRYFKKFGRYPTSIEQLENTNNLRFLRKRYPDPMTPDGKWGLLHVGDVKLGGSNVGTPVSAMASPTGALGQPSTGGAFGQSPTSPTGQQGAPTGSFDGAFIGGQSTTGAGGQARPSSSTTSSSFGTPGVAGGAIIGVASTNEKEGLHEFNDKTHYNEWYFVYDPTTDRGGLITGPFTGKTFAVPGAAGAGTGIPGAQPAGQSTFGQPSSFGQPSTFGQPSGGFGQPSPTPQKPPQQPQ